MEISKYQHKVLLVLHTHTHTHTHTQRHTRMHAHILQNKGEFRIFHFEGLAGKWILKQCISCHLRSLKMHFRSFKIFMSTFQSNGLFKDTFYIEDMGYVASFPLRCTPDKSVNACKACKRSIACV